ncbi:MAG: RNA methyltransferase [Anaerolineales bacterium]
MQLTSRQNPKLKQARALHTRKGREESGLFLVEGIRHVGEAIQAEFPLESIFYAPEILRSRFALELITQAQTRGIEVYEMSADLFATLAEKDAPQGIIAVARQRPSPLASLAPTTQPWLVAALAPQDPGNIGTIIRTVDAVGADGLILLDGGADPWHPTAVRASMGACFWLPIVQTDWEMFAAWLGAYHLYGTSARGTIDYQEVAYTRPAILLLGSEQKGLNPTQAGACEQLIRLPMAGRVSSLNLAVAAGVVLFEMRAYFQRETQSR